MKYPSATVAEKMHNIRKKQTDALLLLGKKTRQRQFNYASQRFRNAANSSSWYMAEFVPNFERKQRYRSLETEKETSTTSVGMMSANLVVIAFVRIIQIVLAAVIFYKSYTLKISSSVEVFCPGTTSPAINYDVKYPFDYIHVASKTDCSMNATEVIDSFSTGFAVTAYLFTIAVVISVAYGVSAILFYALKHQAYDQQKRLPAFDLLASLLIGVVWAITAYMAWSNYHDLQKNTSPDQIQMKATLCLDKSAYCSSFSNGAWEDMNTYLFLGIANILSWGISVWFIFMETGIYPDEDEYGDDILEGDGNVHPPPTFVAFPEMTEKQAMANGAYGNDGPVYGASNGVNDDQLLDYIKNYRNQSNGDRFANGYTFTSLVPSISESVQDKNEPGVDAAMSTKVHNKWNLFQA